MERLASYSLDITPGCPSGATSAHRAGYRGPNGPSFREAFLPTADGLSVYGVMAWEKVVLGRGEYSWPPVCNEIPGVPMGPSKAPLGKSGDDAFDSAGEISAPTMLPGGRSIEYNGWFPGLFAGGTSSCTAPGRPVPSGHRASRRFCPAGLGPAKHVLNGKARSVTLPFLPLVAVIRNPGANSCDLPQCCGIRKEDLYVG